EVAVGASSPQRERSVDEREREGRVPRSERLVRLSQEPLEAPGVERVGLEREGVATLPGGDLDPCGKPSAELGDVDLDELSRGRGSRPPPDGIDELVDAARLLVSEDE